ncbi:MAG TPA: cysteine synthase, partial [Succinivibrionaceae bacterium]|nr:cysteine synthase [Succinivibrionaceae bacterium]
ANPLAHYETTGPEIYADLDGHIDYLVAGAGSGGTYTGVVRYLKEQNPKIQGVLADPEGSTMGGGEHHDYNIEGIGNDFIADTMDMSLVDKVIKVGDSAAFSETRSLAGNEGVIAGTSSGAALSAARALVEGGAKGNIVVIFPDRGDRYFSKGLF